jgi:hypothetical protein
MIGEPHTISLARLMRAQLSVHTQDPGDSGLHEASALGYRRAAPPEWQRTPDGIVSLSEVRFAPGGNVLALGWWEGGEFLLGQKFPELTVRPGADLVFDPGVIGVYILQVEG